MILPQHDQRHVFMRDVGKASFVQSCDQPSENPVTKCEKPNLRIMVQWIIQTLKEGYLIQPYKHIPSSFYKKITESETLVIKIRISRNVTIPIACTSH